MWRLQISFFPSLPGQLQAEDAQAPVSGGVSAEGGHEQVSVCCDESGHEQVSVCCDESGHEQVSVCCDKEGEFCLGLVWPPKYSKIQTFRFAM